MARNEVTLEGFVRKIELRFTPSGTAVLNIDVPIDRRSKNKDTGEWETTNTTWWHLTSWGEDAEYQMDQLSEGDLIQFTGLPEMEKQNGKDGNTYFNAVMKWPRIAKVLRAPRQDGQNGGQGGFQGQGGANTRRGDSGPSQGQQADPWSQQSGGNYDWGNGGDTPPPF